VAGQVRHRTSQDRAAFVARLTPDGALDPSFGSGGWVRLDGDDGDESARITSSPCLTAASSLA